MARTRAPSGRAKWARGRETVRWSEALGAAICARVAGGELLYQVLREAGMPTPQSVGRWCDEHPAFDAALSAARRESGRPAHGGGVDSYCRGVAEEVVQRLCEGESLTAVCRDPTMPSLSTVFKWRRKRPEFEQAYGLAKSVQAERICDESYELLGAATPETAYLTHVRLSHLRWWAGVLAPKIYRLKPTEPERPARQYDVVMRRFMVEVDPVTGEKRMAVYAANPATGQVEREEDTPGRAPPEDD